MIIPEEGKLLLVDKPREWSSFDVVNKLRYALKIKKIGHAGTLDPLATGLLLIGAGKYTKRLAELQGLDKIYEGIIEVGKTTPSFDAETEFDSETSFDHLTEKDILTAVKKFTGHIEQYPPQYSAVKVNGERAYKAARENRVTAIKSREVNVIKFEIDKISLPDIHFTIHCSKGTYIRSIASDLGKVLGVGGYLSKLVRTQIGEYKLADAYQLDTLLEEINSSNASS